MNEKNFESENIKERKKEIRPYLKKVELKENYTCQCGREFKAGEVINEVLTQQDLETQLEHDPESEVVPSLLCDDCLDKHLIRENEDRE